MNYAEDFIESFKSVKLSELQRKGNRARDPHYFGLVRSVIILVRRMVSWCNSREDEYGKKMSFGLLIALSVLHESRTPVALFQLDSAHARVYGHFVTNAC